ncbi:MAG: sugar phosphate isomerase/epimerase family protein [Faecousia sp.]
MMMGVNIPGGTGLSALPGALQTIERDGWQAAELNLSSCPLIIGGKLQPQVTASVKKILADHPLHYTAHAGYGLDLCNEEAPRRHLDVLLSSVDACAELGIDRLNIHYEQHSPKRPLRQQFLDFAAEAAERGAARGVAINVENIEVEDYCHALQAVKRIHHPNLGMTLDLGHLWLSANYFGYDYLDAVRECAPYVRHVHVNDNTGEFEPMRLTDYHVYNTLDRGYRFAFGRGDIHIPPLWGTAPLRDAFAILKQANYPGIWLCEYYSHMFHGLNSGIREAVQAAIEQA